VLNVGLIKISSNTAVLHYIYLRHYVVHYITYRSFATTASQLKMYDFSGEN